MTGDKQHDATTEFNETLAAGFAAGDFEVVGPFYTEDARLMPPRGKFLEGRAAASAFWRGVAGRFSSVAFTTVDLRNLGDTARRETGTYAMGNADGGQVEGKYVFVWLLVEGEWQIETSIWNRNGEAGGGGRRPGQGGGTGGSGGQGRRQGGGAPLQGGGRPGGQGGNGQPGGYRQGGAYRQNVGRPSFQGGAGGGRRGAGGRAAAGGGEGGLYDGNAGPYSEPKG